MRKRIIAFLNWCIWVVEGKAFCYYKYELDVFVNFTLPRKLYELKVKLGLVKRYRFNVIDIAATYDLSNILQRAVKSNADDKYVRNQKKAHLSMERYAQKMRGKKMADVDGMHTLDKSIKLTREEKANADTLYKAMSRR